MRRLALGLGVLTVLGAAPSCLSGAGGGAPPCDAHAVRAAPTFTRKTADVGLGAVRGNRLMAADLDGDGYPDLIVHRVGSNLRGGAAPGDPSPYAVLMNRPADTGGRRFVDVTRESGYGTPRDGTGELRSAQFAVAADVDGDGDLDLFSGTYTDPQKVAVPPSPADLDRSELLLNDGHGHFTLAPPLEPWSSGRGEVTSGASFADLNGDGHVDLWVTAWYAAYGRSSLGGQSRVLLGAGDGTFTDITDGSGVTTETSGYEEGDNRRPAYGATACDVDGDGDQDLLLSAYGRQWNQLFLNDGSAHFEEVGRATGYAGDDELDYSGNQNFLCACQADPTLDPLCPPAPRPLIDCTNSGWPSTDAQPWRNNGNTFTTACGDVTGDGVMDLYNAEIAHWWAGASSDPSNVLVGELSAEGLRYRRADRAAAGLAPPHVGVDWNEGGITAALADLDGGGRLDIVLGTSDYPDQFTWVFHQRSDGQFEEVGEAWGLHHPCGSGLVVADFDRDGDLDVVVGSGTARDCSKLWAEPEVHYYESDAATKANFITVLLEGGPGSNSAAVGARLSLRTADGTRQVREVQGGYGHFGLQSDLAQTFGVGACESAQLEVSWPGGGTSRHRVTPRQLEAVRP